MIVGLGYRTTGIAATPLVQEAISTLDFLAEVT